MSAVRIVASKELREILRDKRVRSSAFVMPAVLIFMMMWIFGIVIGGLAKTEGTRVHVVRSDASAARELSDGKFRVETVDSVQQGQHLIRTGEARIVLEFLPPSSPGRTEVNAYIDPKETLGKIALARIEEFYAKKAVPKVAAILSERGLRPEDIEVVKLNEKEVKVGEETGASEMIVGLLPYLIVIWAFYGGFGSASELVAGEKEKNTLETLLISPARRTQIVLGKFLALSVVCLLSSLSSLAGLALYAAIRPPGAAEMMKEGLGIGPSTLGTILLVLLPAVALFAGLLLAVSTYAKNSREAQSHLSLLSIAVIMPAVFSQFIGLTEMGSALWVRFVPVLNTAANIREALLGKADSVGILITVSVSLVLAAAAIRLAIWLFNREQVLARI